MNGGADVRVRIEGIKMGYIPGQEVIPGKALRPQVLAGGVNKIYRHGDSVGDEDEIHHSFKRGHIHEKGIRQHPKKIQVPEHIGDHKPLQKGDGVVQPAVHHMEAGAYAAPLQQREQQTEHRPEKQQPYMSEFGGIEIVETQFSVIRHCLSFCAAQGAKAAGGCISVS